MHEVIDWNLLVYTLFSGADLGVWIGAFYCRLSLADARKAVFVTAVWLMFCQTLVSLFLPSGTVAVFLRAASIVALIYMAIQTVAQPYDLRGVSWTYLVRANLSLTLGAMDNYVVASSLSGGRLLTIVVVAVIQVILIYSVAHYLTPVLRRSQWFFYLGVLLMTWTAGDLLSQIVDKRDVWMVLLIQGVCLGVVASIGSVLRKRW